ncbi:MAG: RIP metalloprotease RseP [Acholeplasmatales bacterium]|nr:MAG: RIP metalloprotease RseP [Acholeplasmatales bacterium]
MILSMILSSLLTAIGGFIVPILAFIIMLSLVIFIHELGHFVMAKRAGILCHEFAIGMGPIVYSVKKGETRYSLRAIPIGGFVSMAGEEVNEEFVKVGQTVRLVFDGAGHVTRIILRSRDAFLKTDDALEVEVESLDLKGIDGAPLRINDYEVRRDAYYMIGKRALQIAPHERTFESKTKRERFLAIFAGPFMNFVLAFFLFIIIALVVGMPNVDTTEIGSVTEGMPAADVLQVGDVITAIEGSPVNQWEDIGPLMRAEAGNRAVTLSIERDGQAMDVELAPLLSFINLGFSSDRENPEALLIGTVGDRTRGMAGGLRGGDQIIAIDGENVTTWQEVVDRMLANTEGDTMTWLVERDGVQHTLTLEPLGEAVLASQNAPLLQVQVGIGPIHEFSFFSSLLYGFTGLIGTVLMIFGTLGALFRGLVGVTDLGGPVAIYQITEQVVTTGGFIAFLNWTALLSVNLGIINLLPIPALDGGRLVFLGYEAVAGKPVNRKIENVLHFAMFVVLIGFMLFITFNDIFGW